MIHAIFDGLAFLLYISSISYLIFNLLKMRKQNKIMTANLIQEIMDKNVYAEKLAAELDKASQKPIEKTDEFLKFVSESRDWAFEYIENTQQLISVLVKENQELIDSINSKSNKTEIYDAFIKVSRAFSKLKNTLPDDV